MDPFNVYMLGVGGQGIGLLSELLLRAVDHAGFKVKGVDTHGLAQRGGTVVSHLRIGESVYSPMVPLRRADLVIALERNEALRGLRSAAGKGGSMVYYDAVWQPLGVRLGTADPVDHAMIEAESRLKGVTLYKVYNPQLKNPRMQNIMVAATIAKQGLIPGVRHRHFHLAMEDLMEKEMLKENMALFNQEAGGE